MSVAENDYLELESLALKMHQIGESIFKLIESHDVAWGGPIYTLLQHRNDYYLQIQALWSAKEFNWAHLSDAPDATIEHASRKAYDAFELVLSQNATLESLIRGHVQSATDRLIQIDQQKRIEKAYHPQPTVVGGFVREAR